VKELALPVAGPASAPNAFGAAMLVDSVSSRQNT
jgi:hypothetical protein